jgi:hypothetical protein
MPFSFAGGRNLIRFAFFAFALVFIAASGLTENPRNAPGVDAANLIFERDVVSYEIIESSEEPYVKYQYLGEKLPSLLHPDEVVELRTETSYTKRKGYREDGAEQFELIAFTDKTFSKQGGDWYALEHGSVPLATFSAARKESGMASLFWEEVYAATVSPYSAAGDGYVSMYDFGFGPGIGGCSVSLQYWANGRTSPSGTPLPATDIASVMVATAETYDGELGSTFCSLTINRAFLPFDTSAIPSGSTISAANVNVYVYFSADDTNDSIDYITVVRTNQDSHTTLVANDFDNTGATTNPTEGVDSGQRKDITSISTSAYLSFTLNSTGLGWIAVSGQSSNCSSTNGISCFGLREGHEATNLYPGDNITNSIEFYTSERTDTSQDPYLSVTYTAPAVREMRLFGNIRLRGVRLLGL